MREQRETRGAGQLIEKIASRSDVACRAGGQQLMSLTSWPVRFCTKTASRKKIERAIFFFQSRRECLGPIGRRIRRSHQANGRAAERSDPNIRAAWC